MRYWPLILLFLTLFSCGLPEEYDSPLPTYEVVAPIVYSRLDINSADQFDDLIFTVRLNNNQFRQTSGEVVAPFSYDTLGPFEIIKDTADFIQAFIRTSAIRLTITNSFPFNLKAGLIIEYQNNLGEVILRQTLKEDVPPGGEIKLEGLTVNRILLTRQMYVLLINVNSDGTTEPVDLDGLTFDVAVDLDDFFIEEAIFQPSSTYDFDELVAFDLDDLDTADYKGNLIILTNNSLPVGFEMQAYMVLEDSVTVVDSLFLKGQYRAEGQTKLNPLLTRDLWPVTPENLTHLNNSKFLRIKGRTLKANEAYTITPVQALILQLVADLQIKAE